MPKLTRSINSRIESKMTKTESRGYLGMSQLGHACSRYLWYTLHNYYNNEVAPRTLRIWERGNWEEERVIKDLEKLGGVVRDSQASIAIHHMYVLGHIDGIVELDGCKYLFECKTMNDASWKKYCKQDLKEYSLQYWVQAQLYAKYMHVSQIMHVGVNKNTEERHFKIIAATPNKVLPYEIRAVELLHMLKPPPKIGGPEWWECKWCPMAAHCHHNEPKNVVCSACEHIRFADPKLVCAKGNIPIEPCDSFQ